jgi:hypothetical protein
VPATQVGEVRAERAGGLATALEHGGNKRDWGVVSLLPHEWCLAFMCGRGGSPPFSRLDKSGWAQPITPHPHQNT